MSSMAARRSPSVNAVRNFTRSASVGRRLSALRKSSSRIASGFLSESASLRTLPLRARIFAAISGEFIRCKACAMLGSVPRSHSHTLNRTGRPNIWKKYDGIRLSQT